MVSTFENFTLNISDEEKKIATYLAKVFNHGCLKSGWHKNASIAEQLAPNFGKIEERRIRKLIQYIRYHQLAFVISSGKGYKRAENAAEIAECIKSFEERLSAMQHDLRTLKEMALKFTNNGK